MMNSVDDGKEMREKEGQETSDSELDNGVENILESLPSNGKSEEDGKSDMQEASAMPYTMEAEGETEKEKMVERGISFSDQDSPKPESAAKIRIEKEEKREGGGDHGKNDDAARIGHPAGSPLPGTMAATEDIEGGKKEEQGPGSGQSLKSRKGSARAVAIESEKKQKRKRWTREEEDYLQAAAKKHWYHKGEVDWWSINLPGRTVSAMQSKLEALRRRSARVNPTAGGGGPVSVPAPEPIMPSCPLSGSAPGGGDLVSNLTSPAGPGTPAASILLRNNHQLSPQPIFRSRQVSEAALVSNLEPPVALRSLPAATLLPKICPRAPFNCAPPAELGSFAAPARHRLACVNRVPGGPPAGMGSNLAPPTGPCSFPASTLMPTGAHLAPVNCTPPEDLGSIAARERLLHILMVRHRRMGFLPASAILSDANNPAPVSLTTSRELSSFPVTGLSPDYPELAHIDWEPSSPAASVLLGDDNGSATISWSPDPFLVFNSPPSASNHRGEEAEQQPSARASGRSELKSAKLSHDHPPG